MRITDLLKSNAIELNVSLATKDEAIDRLIALHEKAGNLTDAAKYKEDILQRESLSTTAIGEGIAVPHAKSAAAFSFLHHNSGGHRLRSARRQAVRYFVYDCRNRRRRCSSWNSISPYGDAYGCWFYKCFKKRKKHRGISENYWRQRS